MKYPAGYERMWNVTTIFVVDKAHIFDIFPTLSYSTISSTAIKRMHGARREGICMLLCRRCRCNVGLGQR